ncbi:MAG: antibiotic biosynthesis monooxygenase [Eubacterium sp.]|nr:antibiotic biosynthesis monooxygenase [Eubacterium sp.]
MIIVYAKCVVTGQNREAFLELAGKLVEETRKEQGNLSYRLVQSRESQNIYAFVEEWPGQEALDIHMASEHFKKLGAEIGKVVEGSLEITTHELIR